MAGTDILSSGVCRSQGPLKGEAFVKELMQGLPGSLREQSHMSLLPPGGPRNPDPLCPRLAFWPSSMADGLGRGVLHTWAENHVQPDLGISDAQLPASDAWPRS